MYRGEALEDFRGPDCLFVNFKKGDPVYVYCKLAEVSPECWARSVGHIFGYFPKDFIKVVREYTKEELQIPTDETDFVRFDGGRDDFDNYNVEELLGFLKLYDSANEDSEKAIEKVEQFPEVSQDVEPEPKPVVANSEQIESAFSENTMDLEEQFLAQKNHPHSDSQTDNAQGEQTSFEPFEEILPDKLKVPESENNKTSNSSQVSNEQEKTDAYKLLKKEMTLDLKTKFGSTADTLVSDDETSRMVTSLEDDFDDEELDADCYAFDKEEEENEESFGELLLPTFINEEDMKFPVEFGVEKYLIGEEQNSNEEDKVESHILSVAEQMLDNRVNDNRDIGIKESNIFEEAAVLDDIQDLIYFVRYKHSTVKETAPLITANPLEEIWAKAKVLELLITEDTSVDAADTEDHLEIKVEEPADATLLDNILFLLYSFLLYFSKMLFTTLPDDTQPGPDFYGLPWKPVVFTVLFGFVSFVVFFWKTILVIMENKKLIEKLNEVISVNTSELSELQIVLNEAKLREEKVKLECCRLQKENTMLKKKKEQLQQEVKDWSTSHAELSEQIKSFEKSQKDLQVALSHKEDTINALTESEDQNREEESDELTNGEVAGDRNKKIKDQIKQMMDVSRTQTAISVVEEDLKLLQLKLRASMSTNCNLEDQIKKLESNCSSLQSSKVGLEEECKTLRQKVEILNELYQQNEMALQKKLIQEEYKRLEKEQRLSAAEEKVVSAVEEVKNYKRRIEEMEEELQKTERSLKNQIAMQEKKAHDNWLKARSAERAIAEEKREVANLRQKLLEMTQKMAMRQEEAVIVKPMPGRPNLQNPPRRGPLSQNGSFGPSPLSGGECSPPLTAEPAGRPPSATLNRRDMPINGFDPGCGPAHMNSSSRSSSPAKVTDEGKVNMAMKGPPPFSGVPFMGPPMGPPMGRPPPPPIWYGPPLQFDGPFGPRPIPPPFGPGMRPPIGFSEYAPGVPPGKRDLPFDPRVFFPGPAPFRPLGSFGPREYFIPGAPLPPPTHGPQDYGPPPAAKDLMPSGFKDEPPAAPDSQSSEGCSQALKLGP
ncbi:transport and Golgi organization protein 1 homolog isoform X3 [Marmota flaviventris]|uniref:transport and Golgi organization protein 1 homolog isoform X3 n=1 Tax=Marmota flaviventris TaxID=93162 RepID=UPI003A89D3B5